MNAWGYWDQALTYDEYLAQMTTRRDEYEQNYASTTIDEETLEKLVGQDLRFLVITEDWCSDSSQFAPAVAKLASALDDAEIRFLFRPEVQNLAAQYRDEFGRQPIPVIVAMNAEGAELGALLERPTAVTDQMASETIRFASENNHLDGIHRSYANMPEDTKAAVSGNINTWRAKEQNKSVEILFQELGSIVHSPAIA